MLPERFRRLLPPDYEPFAKDDRGSSIIDRFARIVAVHGDGIAVDDGRVQITYRALDEMSDAIASGLLAELGGIPEPVVLLYGQGAAYCAAQLGVIKAGKFFASVDTDLRDDRLLRLLEDLQARVILCSPEFGPLAARLAAALPGCKVLGPGSFAPSRPRPLNVSVSPDALAFVVYTSGSTGDPRGVMISHRHVLHFTMNHANAMHLGRRDRVLQICPLSSVASANEIFPSLLCGATVFPFALKRRGPGQLAKKLRDDRISICTFVPVMFRLLLARLPAETTFPDIRIVRLSGDRILRSDCELFRRHFSDACILRAVLGATECSLYAEFDVLRDELPRKEIVPGGYVLDEMDVAVVDDDMRPLAPGQVGEIAVRSRYLAVGYWRNERLTAERFREPPEADGTRIYLTGDLGYFEDDGCLIHLGRKDSRVKVYGKWVALGDLEEALLELPSIREAVVVPITEGTRETFLAAYYVTEAGAGQDQDSIRRALRERFPAEIVPRCIIGLDALPVTARDKVDRRRLASTWQAYAAGAEVR